MERAGIPYNLHLTHGFGGEHSGDDAKNDPSQPDIVGIYLSELGGEDAVPLQSRYEDWLVAYDMNFHQHIANQLIKQTSKLPPSQLHQNLINAYLEPGNPTRNKTLRTHELVRYYETNRALAPIVQETVAQVFNERTKYFQDKLDEQILDIDRDYDLSRLNTFFKTRIEASKHHEREVTEGDFTTYRMVERLGNLADQAREELILRNRKFIISKIKNRFSVYDPGEVISAGNMLLVKAIDTYDPGHNVRVSTHIGNYLKQLVREMGGVDSIRLPEYMRYLVNDYYNISDELTQFTRGPQSPEHEEIIEELIARKNIVIKDEKAYKRFNKKMMAGLKARSNPSFSDYKYQTRGDQIDDADPDKEPFYEERLADEEEKEAYWYRNEQLRHLLIEIMRYALSSYRFDIMVERYLKEQTLEEVGQRYGITRERVRQIESLSLRRLRKPHISNDLKEYLDDPPNYRQLDEQLEQTLTATEDENTTEKDLVDDVKANPPEVFGEVKSGLNRYINEVIRLFNNPKKPKQ